MSANNQVHAGSSPRSYVVVWDHEKPKVIGSTWVPGYTKAHTETPDQAIGFELLRLEEQEATIKMRKLALMELAGEL